ncbi:cupredoxin domain-containing protein [Acinetobacter nectaris]|nr:cupredoxin domain-containing protein [Acinetobacter nectaris]MCF9028444.1 cupredoxin domain-containing protein [Acinetobacter nectaris]MCF9035135.1 cupredoxin domain-containing protein [Acinetobacter nectaris]MCF9046735.1 cupredoxin domain-containing protein [Acinetobacter nectaris]
MKNRLLLSIAVLVSSFSIAMAVSAADRENIKLTLTDKGFIPNKITVHQGQKLLIQMTNTTQKVAELESYDMKFEKIATPGGTITVFAGPLNVGTYTFFDDYSSTGVKGTLQATP